MEKKLALVIDDEKNIRLTFSETLAQMGFDTHAAASGEEALSKMKTTDFDLALLDFRMSGMRRDRGPALHSGGVPESARHHDHRPRDDRVGRRGHETRCRRFYTKALYPAEIRELVGTVMEREALDESKGKDYPTLIELAKKCITDHLFDAAGAHVRKAVAIDPSRPEAFNLLGAILEIQGAHPSEALKNYHAALSLDPSYVPARKNIERIAGENKYRRGKIDIDRD